MDTRQKILEATADLILEEGLDATRISKIARRADLTDGALYRHFDNKDDLLREVYLEVDREIERYVRRFGPQEGTPEERFVRFLTGVYGSFLVRPDRLVLFEALHHATSVNREDKAGALEASFGFLARLFEEAEAQGIIRRELSHATVILAIYGALGQLIRNAYHKGRSVEPADLREVVEIFWRGMQ